MLPDLSENEGVIRRANTIKDLLLPKDKDNPVEPYEPTGSLSPLVKTPPLHKVVANSLIWGKRKK